MAHQLVALLGLLAGPGANAAEPPAAAPGTPAAVHRGVSADAVRTAIEAYITTQTATLPGTVSVKIGAIGNPDLLKQCARIAVSANPGARPYGRTVVRVRCLEGAWWNLAVPVRITVMAPLVTTVRTISPGELIGAQDVTLTTTDLGEHPNGALSRVDLAVGRAARSVILAGKVLQADMLKAVNAVEAGQQVKVLTHGPGFEASNSGIALNSAALGDVARVRLGNGQIISAKVSGAGQVEVAF